MTAKEQTLWEQAIRVLRQNSVVTTVASGVPEAEVVVKARKQAPSQRDGRRKVSR